MSDDPKYFAQRINDLYKRMMLVIGRAQVQIVDDTQNVQSVQLEINVGETRDKTFNFQHFGFSSNLPPLTDCAVVFLGGDRNQGVIIGSNNAKFRFKNLASGETVIYDAFGKSILLGESGIVVNANGQPVAINNAAAVTVNCTSVHIVSAGDVIIDAPLLKVSGDIVDNYAINTDNASSMRSKYNAHKHPGVTAGGASTATTDTPM